MFAHPRRAGRDNVADAGACTPASSCSSTRPVEGSEEYLDSEKYQLRPRDFAGALRDDRSLQPWLTRLNEIRRAHPALQQLRTLHFHHIDNDALLAYSKTDPATGDTVLVVVNLDPHEAQRGHALAGHARAGLRTGTTRADRARRGVRADLAVGPGQLRAAGPGAAVAHIITLTEAG